MNKTMKLFLGFIIAFAALSCVTFVMGLLSFLKTNDGSSGSSDGYRGATGATGAAGATGVAGAAGVQPGATLTGGELTQLANIDTTVITSAQWGYVGGVQKQDVSAGADVTFANFATVVPHGVTYFWWDFNGLPTPMAGPFTETPLNGQFQPANPGVVPPGVPDFVNGTVGTVGHVMYQGAAPKTVLVSFSVPLELINTTPPWRLELWLVKQPAAPAPPLVAPLPAPNRPSTTVFHLGTTIVHVHASKAIVTVQPMEYLEFWVRETYLPDPAAVVNSTTKRGKITIQQVV